MAINKTTGGGLFIGVDDSTDPEDDQPNTPTGAVNMYLPDPVHGSGAYSRPGCSRNNMLPTGSGQGEGVYCHVAADGTVYNFLFSNGKVYRQNADLTSAPTDVTPTNLRIATGGGMTPGFTFSRAIFCCSLNDQLIVNDSVNKPWIGTNLSATPITGTVIDFRSAVTNLSRGTVADTKIKNASFVYSTVTGGVPTTATASAAETTLPAGTIPLNTWGIFLWEINSSGTVVVTPGAANFTTGYATEALAIAALPAKTVLTSWFGGYFTIQTKIGTTFVDGTDALQGGASGNVANATNYYAGESPPWVAFGWPRVGTGAVHFVMRSDGLTSTPTAICWSEPNQPNVGYLQTNYNNTFTLTQTGSTPIYCVFPTGSGCYYSRDLSWGYLRGAPNLYTNNPTQDTLSVNSGCVAPGTVWGFGNYVYYSDMAGRTNRFAVGSTSGIEPLWMQARAAYDASAAASGATNTIAIQNYSWAVIEPNLNLYILGAYPTTTGNFAPSTFYVYDAQSGKYCGTWTVGGQVSMNTAGILRDSNNQPAMIWLQAPDGSANGYIWKLNRAAANVWQDNSATVPVSLSSARLAYSAQYRTNVVQIRVLTNNVTPVSLSTLMSSGTVSQGTQTPPTSSDGTYRAVWTADGATVGRGVICTVTPTTTTSQWQCYRVEIDYTQELASVGEP